MQQTMGKPFGLKERWELVKFDYLTPGFRLQMLRPTPSLLGPWFHPRKVKNVDYAREKYKHVVNENWEIQKAS